MTRQGEDTLKTLVLLLALVSSFSVYNAQVRAEGEDTSSSTVQASEQKLTDIKKIFVGSLGSVSGSEYIRQKLINALSKTQGITIVDSAEKADAILLGSAEIGHHRTFTVGAGFVSSVPNFQADTVLRLEGKNRKPLWTDEISSRKHFSHLSGKGASSDVIAKIVARLSEAINTNDAQIAAKRSSANHM